MFQRFSLLILLFFLKGNAMAQVEQESNLKAVFIYNFTNYVDWNIDLDETEFVIGIVGTSVIDKSILQIAATKLIKNRRVVIKHFYRLEDIGYCHILFIPHGCSIPLQSILEKTDKGVLTISEEPGFANQGTAFNFIVMNDKLKFEANIKAINSAGLKASAQLLKLAIIIN